MNCLLDTHALLWALQEPEILPIRVQSTLADPSATVLISIVTPWEMAIKAALGKLDASDLLDDFDGVLMRGQYTLLETALRHVIQAGFLPPHHRDPFDRLLAAQALELRIPLISGDRIFDLYGVKRIWD